MKAKKKKKRGEEEEMGWSLGLRVDINYGIFEEPMLPCFRPCPPLFMEDFCLHFSTEEKEKKRRFCFFFRQLSAATYNDSPTAMGARIIFNLSFPAIFCLDFSFSPSASRRIFVFDAHGMCINFKIVFRI
jgi:hypothetical protein